MPDLKKDDDRKPIALLPASNPRAANEVYNTSVPSTHPPYGGSQDHMSMAWASWASKYHQGQGGAHYGANSTYTPQPYWRRYIAVLERGSKRIFAKVIIQEDLKPWAEKSGYQIVRSSQIYGSINPEKERTEFSK